MEAMDSIASCVRNGEQYTVMGFRSGEIITVLLNKDGVTQSTHGERLGGTVARVLTASEPGAKPMVLVSSDSELTFMTDFERQGTQGAGMAKTKHRVWPVDLSKPMEMSPAVDSVTVLPKNLLSESDSTTPLLLISGPRILFTELQLQPGPAHRHIPVDGTPDRILYSHRFKCLIVAVRRGTQPTFPTLAFIDPDTGEDVGFPSDKHGATYEFARGLGKPDDKVMALGEWEYKKEGHVWHFLILGMRHGRLMVMSLEKDKEAPEGRQPKIRYWTRFQRKGLESPVYSVLGHDDKLIYCVGNIIQWEVIDTAEKKLRQIDEYELASAATSLMVINGRLAALSAKESVEIIERMPSEGSGPAQLIHSDPLKRNTFHMIEVGGSPGNEPSSSLILVSDQFCGIGGLWTSWQTPGKDCETVFEAELQASIRRFARGRTRPPWEQGAARKPRYGRIAMTVDDAEILGVCMDGSLLQFQLLNMEVWQLMRFILNLAMMDAIINPSNSVSQDDIEFFDPEPIARPDMMHIDGDKIQSCVQKRALERLIALPRHMSRFKDLLDDMEDGRLTDEITSTTDEEEDAGYFALAYRILQHFLAPVL
jgi:hypothetical protein